MSLRAVRFTKEVTPGVFPTSPAAGTQSVLRLHANESFEAQPTPIHYNVRDAGGSNRVVQTGSAQSGTGGKLMTLFYFSQAKLLLPWALSLAGAPLGVGTGTFDYVWQLEDGTFAYRRYLGATCKRFQLSANNSGDGVLCALAFDFDYLAVASITNTDFAVPALTAYPSDQPVVFQQLVGGLTLGSSRTNFKEISLSVENQTKPLYDEFKFPSAIRWLGRDVTFNSSFRYKSQADRTALESVSAQTASLAFTDGTNTTTFDLKTAGVIRSVSDSMPLNDAAYQGLSFASLLDATAGTDISVATTP
ncbi:hypothetical protein [Singulisphaera sp. PoT]|uniref:hypothetical protein n=1 Tax=Singulisphaera sp. PoT TaxID=3411797 RepID=UPI003BF4E31B